MSADGKVNEGEEKVEGKEKEQEEVECAKQKTWNQKPEKIVQIIHTPVHDALFPVSATNKVPRLSIVMPHGWLKLA